MDEIIKIHITPVLKEGGAVCSFCRTIMVDGKQVYSDNVTPHRHLHGKDRLSVFVRQLEYEAGYRGNVRHTRQNTLRKCWVGRFQLFQLQLQCLVLKTKIVVRKLIGKL